MLHNATGLRTWNVDLRSVYGSPVTMRCAIVSTRASCPWSAFLVRAGCASAASAWTNPGLGARRAAAWGKRVRPEHAQSTTDLCSIYRCGHYMRDIRYV
jgi:hypothetical protein